MRLSDIDCSEYSNEYWHLKTEMSEWKKLRTSDESIRLVSDVWGDLRLVGESGVYSDVNDWYEWEWWKSDIRDVYERYDSNRVDEGNSPEWSLN